MRCFVDLRLIMSFDQKSCIRHDKIIASRWKMLESLRGGHKRAPQIKVTECQMEMFIEFNTGQELRQIESYYAGWYITLGDEFAGHGRDICLVYGKTYARVLVTKPPSSINRPVLKSRAHTKRHISLRKKDLSSFHSPPLSRFHYARVFS